MFTVALIGGDGAGKTTIANEVIKTSGLPIKYLYMGLSTRSSNHALFTSRFVLFIKRRIYKNEAKGTGSIPGDIPVNQLEYYEQKHSWIWNTARFLNRLAEAWYRQLISLSYQLRGYMVLYDRHFFFDTAPIVTDSQDGSTRLDRLSFWLMSHWYPKPTLTIFLDASPELLYSRKGEASPEYLAQQRSVYLEQGKKLPQFVCVDASKPLDKVLEEVKGHIQDFYARR